MGNSIRTTSSATPANQTTFKAGNSALIPSLGNYPFVLTNDPYGQRDLLSVVYDGSYFYYDRNGYSVSAQDTETLDYQPSLFHDTPANRAAIATLYGLNIADSVERLSNDSVQKALHPQCESCQNNREENHLDAKDYRTVEQRFLGISEFCSPALKVINSIDDDDDEAVLISACTLSDTACDILSATEVMHDIGQLLHLIYSEKISTSQVKSMARLVHDTTDRWHSILQRSLNTLNEPLEQTKYGKVEG